VFFIDYGNSATVPIQSLGPCRVVHPLLDCLPSLVKLLHSTIVNFLLFVTEISRFMLFHNGLSFGVLSLMNEI
jgi:hypothetical protein